MSQVFTKDHWHQTVRQYSTAGQTLYTCTADDWRLYTTVHYILVRLYFTPLNKTIQCTTPDIYLQYNTSCSINISTDHKAWSRFVWGMGGLLLQWEEHFSLTHDLLWESKTVFYFWTTKNRVLVKYSIDWTGLFLVEGVKLNKTRTNFVFVCPSQVYFLIRGTQNENINTNTEMKIKLEEFPLENF